MAERRKSVAMADGLPFSKGLMASSLMVTGLGPLAAYEVANRIEKEMISRGNALSREELQDLTVEVLRREAGEKYAAAAVKWQSVAELDIPLIILIGGATGVGKSTIATQLATRLGITRVVSTDAVREVLRSALTQDMFPTLYASSFEADKAVRQPIPHSGDRLIIGFREQAASVAVGAQALIDRAIEEGTDMILEGAHLVPGFLEGVGSDRAVIVPLVLMIEEEELHKSHFTSRQRENASSRPSNRYLRSFKKIRRIQKYMIDSARMRGVPTIPTYGIDATLAEIIDHVTSKALEKVETGEGISREDEEKLGRVIEVMETKDEGSPTREVVP